MTPRELVFAHRCAEAAAAYEALLRQDPGDPAIPGGYARALLCLGRLNEALEQFKRADSFEKQELEGKSQPHLDHIGTCLWLLGQRQEAIETFKTGVDSILDGSLTYGDLAGGVSHGLLLWYAGTTAREEAVCKNALRYLRNRAKRKAIKHWPGHLALFVLGQISEPDLLAETSRTSETLERIESAERDAYNRRRLVKAFFYVATQRRSEGKEGECREGMIKCSRLENPIIEVEWYLAKAEAAQGLQR